MLIAENASVAENTRRGSTDGPTTSWRSRSGADDDFPAEMVLSQTSLAANDNATAVDKPRSVLADVVELSKPRIVTMILVTTVATALIGGGGAMPLLGLLTLLLGTAGVAASAGAANQIWERVIDCGMTRTAVRPLPSGRMQTATATLICAVWGIGGTAILWTLHGAVPAIVGVLTWALYVLVYTPMKTRTYWNTTVGAIAGAMPVLIGYTATGGLLSEVTGWLLFGILAAWQFPHFMAIAWLYRRQYAEAGFEMTTTVEPTGRSAGYQSLAGSWAIALCGAFLCFLSGSGSGAFVATALVLALTWPLLSSSLRFFKAPNDLTARKMLRASLLVLPGVLLVVTVRILW